MTKEQKIKAYNEVIMLDIKDVMTLTGWGENVTRSTFAYDKEFPSIKKILSSRIERTKKLFIT